MIFKIHHAMYHILDYQKDNQSQNIAYIKVPVEKNN